MGLIDRMDIDQSAKEKLKFGAGAVFSIGVSAFLSFVFFAFMTLEYEGKHKSTAGDRGWTGRDIILGDIENNLMSAFFLVLCLAIICLVAYQEIYLWPDNYLTARQKDGQRLRLFTLPVLLVCGINFIILYMGPVIAAVNYYYDWAPFFAK